MSRFSATYRKPLDFGLCKVSGRKGKRLFAPPLKLLPLKIMFLRQAARRCAQGRRTTSVARVVRTGLHTSAGPSRTQVTRRDVFLGTAAAVVGFGIWRYNTRMDSVYLDAEGQWL